MAYKILSLNLYHDLELAQQLFYLPNQLTLKNLMIHGDSKDYGACDFYLNDRHVQFRIAKTTSTKLGLFVTFWKRIGTGPILPYDLSDDFDLLIVSVAQNQQLGQFVFPKQILYQEGVIAKNNIGGKRAIRVYPPWVITTSQQAHKTQSWQLKYFFSIAPTLDLNQALSLFKP